MEENMKEVYSANDEYKVDIIREVLSENKIESLVLNQKGSALLLGEIHLYVNEKDEDKALEIISKHEI
jgi:hypothetical protein